MQKALRETKVRPTDVKIVRCALTFLKSITSAEPGPRISSEFTIKSCARLCGSFDDEIFHFVTLLQKLVNMIDRNKRIYTRPMTMTAF